MTPPAVNVLVVDDELTLQRLVAETLEEAGFHARKASNAQEALAELRRGAPDLMILDVRMPGGMSGFELCRAVRASPEWKNIPVIFLTSKEEQVDKVLGLELGGDDYMVKPFGGAELVARVKAVLRRARGGAADQDVLKGGAVTVDVKRRTVRLGKKTVDLPAKNFDLLAALLAKDGAVLTRGYLMETVWGRDHDGTSRTLDTHVYELRKLLGKYGACIQSVGQVGYKWKNL